MALKKKSKSATNDVSVNVTNTRTGEIISSNGAPLEPYNKYNCPKESVGMAIGVTKNMGDYESLRIDVWCTDTLNSGETKEQAFERLSETLSQVLYDTANDLAGD